ncbi:MAG: flavin reductase family protein [Solirubrobacterales bacterium]
MSRGDFRAAFARLATNVAVITVAGPHGCTANAWAEAHDPPLILVTMRREGQTYKSLREARCFAVNVLAEGQTSVATRFAGPRERRFEGTEIRIADDGLPIVEEALVSIRCSLAVTHPFGAYDIVVGSVDEVAIRPDGSPLVYADGAFHGLREPDHAEG